MGPGERQKKLFLPLLFTMVISAVPIRTVADDADSIVDKYNRASLGSTNFERTLQKTDGEKISFELNIKGYERDLRFWQSGRVPESDKSYYRMRAEEAPRRIQMIRQNISRLSQQEQASRTQTSSSLFNLAEELQQASTSYLLSGERQTKAEALLNRLSGGRYFRTSEEKAEALGDMELQARTAAGLASIPHCSPEVAMNPDRYDIMNENPQNRPGVFQITETLKCYQNLTRLPRSTPEQDLAKMAIAREIASVCLLYPNVESPEVMEARAGQFDQFMKSETARILQKTGSTVAGGVAVRYTSQAVASKIAASAACGAIGRLATRWARFSAVGARAGSWLMQTRPLLKISTITGGHVGTVMTQTARGTSAVLSRFGSVVGSKTFGAVFGFLISTESDELGCNCQGGEGAQNYRDLAESQAKKNIEKELRVTCPDFLRRLGQP